MTAEEHYREAERLLETVKGGVEFDEIPFVQARLTRAHVHATLALVAATRPGIALPEHPKPAPPSPRPR
jgi:hypothetical protein